MHALQLNFPTRHVLEANLAQLKAELLMAGAPAIEPAHISVENFAAAPEETQKAILDNISTYVQILAQETEVPKKDRRLHEIARLKSALRAFGLKALTEEVFDVISEDDVIELYSDREVQLYRNMRFFKVCSYSLLDLSVNPWDQLYEKPQWVVEATLGVIDRVLSTATGPVAYDIPAYVQKEKFKHAKVLRAFKATPKFLSPVFDLRTGNRAGAISTYSAELVAEGVDCERLTIF